MQTDLEFITPKEKTQVSSSSIFETTAGRLAALFSHKRKPSQDFHSDRHGHS